MIYDHRTGTIKLHQPDKRFLSGAYSLLVGLNKVNPCKETNDAMNSLAWVMKQYGVKGDEHLPKEIKEEVADLLEPADHFADMDKKAKAGRGAPWIEE